MGSGTAADALIESASEVYQYVADMQFAVDPPLGVSAVKASRCDVSDGFAVLHLDGPVPDTAGLMLSVGGRVLQESDAGFDRYDEISRTVVVRPGEDVLGMMREPSVEVLLLSDMKFLIATVGEFYRRYGTLLRMPETPPPQVLPRFPEGSEPSIRQRQAVDCILSHPASYIWGAPGTGKTQFVLAACIRGLVSAGGRVAVIAPTNNSVEQVLRGVLAAIPEGDPVRNGILRMGVPTKGFFEQHPEMCEDRQAQRRIDAGMRSLDVLDEVLYERACDELEDEILRLWNSVSLLPEEGGETVMPKDGPVREAFDDLRPLFDARPRTRDLATEVVDGDASRAMALLVDAIYGRQRPASDLEEYEAWSDADLIAGMLETEKELEMLRAGSPNARVQEAAVLAMTPHQYLSRFRPRGTDEDGRMELDVNHIFLDEAGYCGLVQAASLFANGVPVTFLGDHMQLPPVSQLDDGLLRSAAERGGRLRYGFLWSMSSLHCEGLLEEGAGVLSKRFLDIEDPVFMRTGRADLCDSHRFGANLARVLDGFVYRNGMAGSSDGGDLEISCIDAVCDSREGRDNTAEADAIKAFLKRESPEPSSLVVLTPYSVQLALIKRNVGRRYRDSVMTVHGSQGREWDTVILSVADNGIMSREVPFRFTSSETPIGLRVINTAVSRAKRRLIMVCDREFWLAREGELIGGILREVPPEGVMDFNRRRRGPAGCA